MTELQAKFHKDFSKFGHASLTKGSDPCENLPGTSIALNEKGCIQKLSRKIANIEFITELILATIPLNF